MNYVNAQPVKSKRRLSGVGKQMTEVREQRSERLLDPSVFHICRLSSENMTLEFNKLIAGGNTDPKYQDEVGFTEWVLTKQPVRLLWKCLDGCEIVHRRLTVKVIGLTGGIATGKSTVAVILENAGAVIIDADRIARETVKKGLPAYREIVAHFGESVLLPDGEINRSALGDIIFNAPRKKQLLNKIVHPHVRKETHRQLQHIEHTEPNAIVILDIPLLFEAEMDKDLSEVIVVYVPEQIQIKRLMKRDHLTRADARARIRSQLPVEEKKRRATIVIDNSGTREDTRKRTLEIYKRLKNAPASP